MVYSVFMSNVTAIWCLIWLCELYFWGYTKKYQTSYRVFVKFILFDDFQRRMFRLYNNVLQNGKILGFSNHVAVLKINLIGVRNISRQFDIEAWMKTLNEAEQKRVRFIQNEVNWKWNFIFKFRTTQPIFFILLWD